MSTNLDQYLADRRAKSGERLILGTALMLRAVIIGALIYIIDDLASLGSSPLFTAVFAALGVFAAPALARSRLNSLGIAAAAITGAAGWCAAAAIISYFGAALGVEPLRAYSAIQHLDIFVAAFLVSITTTAFFLRHESMGTLEALLLALGGVSLLAGHRNFHFEMPRAVNDFAWSLGIGNLAALIILAGALLAIILAYLFLAALPWAPFRASRSRALSGSSAKVRRWALVGTVVAAAVIFFSIGSAIQSYYAQEAFSRTANGVGESTKEGKSPLGFHSALGGTNQPAALVRLEGDYKENPTSPMLYLREAALSEMEDNEIVQASSIYDRDVSWSKPTQAFQGQADLDLEERVPVNQSVFLLADQDNSFAVDYPLSIVQLKNPNPGRFKSAYRAYSMAPAFKLPDLAGFKVGDPRWSEETKQHYLVTHKDPRYEELAKKLAGEEKDPILKAKAITDYLTNTAIYTLTPNHEVKGGEDPVAPFLFGDRRGYCVHFAHAIVYMLRSLGIPSRIGTGYLTDLSQSKDGHILLRMADRHAWAEVYISHRGWVPFDIQPKQVESHGDLQVDMKLLEELMGMVDPGEEIVSTETIKDEANVTPPSAWQAPDISVIIAILGLAAAILIGIKIHLRYAWIITKDPSSRLRRSYASAASSLHDLGIRRRFGETRLEFASRISALGLSADKLSKLLILSAYSKPRGALSIDDIDAARQEASKSLNRVHWAKRLLSALNPSSTLSFLSRSGW